MKDKMKTKRYGANLVFSQLQFEDFLLQHQSSGGEPKKLGIDLSCLHERTRVKVGLRQTFGEIYHRFGWDNLFRATRVSANRTLKEVVLARIAQPQSKRELENDFEHNDQVWLNLNSVIRCLDKLDVNKVKEIQQKSYEMAQSLLPSEVTTIFCHLMSLYIDSEKHDEPHSEHLREKVLFALLLTPEGLPVGYEIFHGNVIEAQALDALRAPLNGAEIIVVADAKVINNANEKALQELGVPYIQGARLRNLSDTITNEIFDLDSYSPWVREENSSSISKFRCIKDKKRNLIVTCSKKRTRKNSTQTPWIGLRGIITRNCDNHDPHECVIQYRRLSTLGANFRTSIHDLSMHPFHHLSLERIRAHFAVCYMAFSCMDYLNRLLELNQTPLNPDLIRKSLSKLEISIVNATNDDRTFCMPSNPDSNTQEIYKVLGLKWSRNPFVYKMKTSIKQ